jgi:hypothetical protein
LTQFHGRNTERQERWLRSISRRFGYPEAA